MSEDKKPRYVCFRLGDGRGANISLLYRGKMPAWWVRFLFRKFAGITWEWEKSGPPLPTMNEEIAALAASVIDIGARVSKLEAAAEGMRAAMNDDRRSALRFVQAISQCGVAADVAADVARGELSAKLYEECVEAPGVVTDKTAVYGNSAPQTPIPLGDNSLTC